jgi:hypothetical protein
MAGRGFRLLVFYILMIAPDLLNEFATCLAVPMYKKCE